MSQHDKDKLMKFFDALYEDKESDITEIRKDLDASGIDLQRIESAVKDLLKDAKRTEKLNWLTKAQKMRSKINEVYEKQIRSAKAQFKDVREFVKAIQDGQFGAPLQEKANAFFRNQDFKQISEADLISFVEDCQVLDLLSKIQGENE